MKNSKNKDISISDLVNEFHVSKAAIELYGVHRLLLPLPDKKSKPAYRPLDKARLKFITRAKDADYTIGNIKELIGALDLEKNEVDQIEESLVYCKKKSAALTDSLEGLDALEQINVTCDIELLDAYITDLKNLKYGLNDISPIKTALPDPDTKDSHPKPRTLVYSHIADQIAGAPVIAPKKSRRSLVVVAGVFLLVIAAYLYLGSDPVPDIADNQAAPLQMEASPEKAAPTATSNKTEEINPSETVTSLDESGGALVGKPGSDAISLSKTDMNPDKDSATLANEPKSTEGLISLLDFPALKSKSNSPSADPMTSMPGTDSDEQAQDTKNTQALLLDIIKESQQTTPTPGTPEIEETENIFLKQLFADMKKKYDQQAQSQKPAIDDITGISATSETMSEEKETQNIVAVDVPDETPRTSETTTATAKTPQIKTTPAPPKPVEPRAVTRAPASLNTGTPYTNTGAPLQAVTSPKPASPVLRPKSSTQQESASTKKAETSTLSKGDASPDKTITPPKPKLEPKPQPEPKLEPKPKTITQKPTNPEALKWVQKSYESVMSGDAGEAIITASVAITLDPNLVNAYINRSWAYSKKGLYDRAIQDCNKALDIDNENALAYNNRGLAFQGKGDVEKAKSDYERACELGFDIGCKNYQEVAGSKAGES